MTGFVSLLVEERVSEAAVVLTETESIETTEGFSPFEETTEEEAPIVLSETIKGFLKAGGRPLPRLTGFVSLLVEERVSETHPCVSEATVVLTENESTVTTEGFSPFEETTEEEATIVLSETTKGFLKAGGRPLPRLTGFSLSETESRRPLAWEKPLKMKSIWYRKQPKDSSLSILQDISLTSFHIYICIFIYIYIMKTYPSSAYGRRRRGAKGVEIHYYDEKL